MGEEEGEFKFSIIREDTEYQMVSFGMVVSGGRCTANVCIREWMRQLNLQ